MTASMSLYANAASSATVAGSPERRRPSPSGAEGSDATIERRRPTSFDAARRLQITNHREEATLAALYTFDVFSTLDGYGSYGPDGDWGGYWSKEGPEFLDRRLALYSERQRLVIGANTMRMFMGSIGPRAGFLKDVDPVNGAMRDLPTTVVSTTLEEPLDWPDATLERGDAVDVVARLKAVSDMPLRSHGSLSMNRALMAAGLVDRVQVTIFPVVSGRTGARPVFERAADFDLELIESRTLDGRIQELIYRPTLHG
jgi:dihydrofolate reductase